MLVFFIYLYAIITYRRKIDKNSLQYFALRPDLKICWFAVTGPGLQEKNFF